MADKIHPNKTASLVNQSRRDFFVNSALVSTGALIASPVARAGGSAQAATKAVNRAKILFADYFRTLGYSAAEPKTLNTLGQHAQCQGSVPGPDHAYTVTNGDLRYDDEIETAPGSLFVFQGAARIGDIPRKGLPNVLPFFTIGVAASNELSRKGEMIDILFEFLVHTAGLSPKNLSVTTTELAAPYLDQFRAFGITPDRIRLRKLEAAKAAAQGSGWLLNPVTGFGGPSVSIEYRRGNMIQEIGEITLRESIWADSTTEVGGFGIERLAWAQTGHRLGWNHQVEELLSTLRAESTATGVPLPIGYDLFAATV